MSFIKKMMYFNKIVSKTKLHCLLFLMGQQTLNHTDCDKGSTTFCA